MKLDQNSSSLYVWDLKLYRVYMNTEYLTLTSNHIQCKTKNCFEYLHLDLGYTCIFYILVIQLKKSLGFMHMMFL